MLKLRCPPSHKQDSEKINMCLDPRPSNEKKKGKQSIVKEKIQGLSTKRWEGWRGKKRRRRRRKMLFSP